MAIRVHFAASLLLATISLSAQTTSALTQTLLGQGRGVDQAGIGVRDLAGVDRVPGAKPLAGQISGALPPPINVTNVRSAFELCKQHAMFGHIADGMARRGDDASASLLRTLDPKELATPENTKAYLCLVRLAFWKPDSVPDREEKIPGVTMFLLECLKERHSDDEALKAEINSMEAYVKQQTQELPKNSQGSLTRHPPE